MTAWRGYPNDDWRLRRDALYITEQRFPCVRSIVKTASVHGSGGIMSARNGQRARFHRNRKRRVVQRIRLRAVLQALREQKAAPVAPAPRRRQGGPALAASS